MKIVFEQLSLLLLLLSCANKANLISIFYLGILLMFLLVKNKTTAMLYMSYTFGTVLAFEYLLTLFNLSSANSPMIFPENYPIFPPIVNGTATSPFMIPIFLNSQSLTNNLEWAAFFSIDFNRGAVNDIWFDFANLVILTIYFFSFGNPVNTQGLKVSLSKTSEIEESLKKYSKIQMKKKVLLLGGHDTTDIHWGKKTNDSFDSLDAADPNNSQDYFMGSTQFLNDLKSRIFIYNFTKKTKMAIFVGGQIVTLLIIFSIAIVCKSLMSVGYLIMCVPLFWSITDFFNLDKMHQEKKKWMHPYIISGPLMYFSFFDIGLQIIFQSPFVSDSSVGLLQVFGFEKIFNFNKDVTYEQILRGEAKLATVN